MLKEKIFIPHVFIKVAVVIATLLFSLSTFSQTSNLRVKTLKIEAESTTLDSLSIVPETFHCFIDSIKVSPAGYYLNWINASFLWLDSIPNDSITFVYRVYPENYSIDIFRKDTTQIVSNTSSNFNPFVIDANDTDDGPFSSELNKSGSITRGIALGNNQNLSINSSLDLQLNGKINDRYSVLASISDENIPIQPDGNTQQLQDFDNVFIQLFDDKSSLTAGDFTLDRRPGYFMKYHKKALGLTFQWQEQNEEESTKIESSLAVSKGKFARNIIQGIEGNQGPYRLRGGNNEPFIIVLSGSERVFIDGQMLTRGQNADYVINYNSSEITFTANSPITKDRRIIVEFQYSDKNYARSMLQSDFVKEKEKFSWFVGAFAEQDSKNQSLQQDLSDEERRALSLAGDDLLSASVSGVDSVGFSNELLLYARIDSLGFDPVYISSSIPEQALFQVTFSDVGFGNGDYIEGDFTANGKLFQWIAPEFIDGVLVHYGNYAPIRVLVAPNKRQMVTSGFRWRLNEKLKFNFQGAVSNNDLNTFSPSGNSDNVGYGLKSILEYKTPLKYLDSEKKTKPVLEFISTLGYESNNSSFSEIERFRTVEFTRDWNINSTEKKNLDLLTGSIGLQSLKSGSIDIGGEYFSLDDFKGQKANLRANLKFGDLTIFEEGSMLQSKGAVNSTFNRHKSKVEWTRGPIKLGFKDEFEENRKELETGFDPSTYYFYDYELYVANSDTLRNNFKVFYRERNDKRILDSSFSAAARAEQYGVSTNLISNPRNQLQATISNRKLIIVNNELLNLAPESTLLGQLNHMYKSKNNWFQANTFYSVGSGLEQKREFIYLEVPSGQGSYVWIDYNEDDIKDLNEFEVAAFAYEANYIRTFIPSDDYVRVYSNSYTQNVQLFPAKIWTEKNKVQKVISKFSTNTVFRTERKTNFEEDKNRFNPFIDEVADTTLISLSNSWRNTLFYQRTNTKFGMEYTIQSNLSKVLLTNGFESRGNRIHEIVLRWNFVEGLTFNSVVRSGLKTNASDFLFGRNFSISTQEVSPSLSWTPEAKYLIKLNSRIISKENSEDLGGESSFLLDLGVEGRINKVKVGTFASTVNVIRIAYDGNQNNSLGFEMLEGLQPGTNVTWSVGLNRKISKNIQLTLNYFGRKSEDDSAIHSGGLNARAFF